MQLTITYLDFEKQFEFDWMIRPLEFMLQSGYLLSDRFNIVGYTAFASIFKESNSLMSTIEIAKLIRSKPYKFLMPSKELSDYIDNYIELNKVAKTFKHPPREIFVEYKVAEKRVMNRLNAFIDEVYQMDTIKRLARYSKLSLIDQVDVFSLNESTIAVFKDGLNFESIVKQELTTSFNKDSIWFVNSDLMSDFFIKESRPGPEETNGSTDQRPAPGPKATTDGSEKDIHFEHLLSFPDISDISLPELTALKESLAQGLSTCKRVLAEWARKCYAGENAGSYIQGEGKELLRDLSAIVQENMLVGHFRNLQKPENCFNLYLTELDAFQFFCYYLLNARLDGEAYAECYEELRQKDRGFTIPVILVWPGPEPLGIKKLKNISDENPEKEGDGHSTGPLEADMPLKKKQNINID